MVQVVLAAESDIGTLVPELAPALFASEMGVTSALCSHYVVVRTLSSYCTAQTVEQLVFRFLLTLLRTVSILTPSRWSHSGSL
jgi:hypothetical protein